MLLFASLALAETWAQLAPTALEPSMPLPAAATAALGEREHAKAVAALQAMDLNDLSAAQQADHAFLLAWELVRAGKAAEATKHLELLRTASSPPPEYVALLEGEVLQAAGKPLEAAVVLAKVQGDSPIAARAQLALAEAYRSAERESDARKVYEAIAARPDPTPGNEKALGWLLARVGKSSAEAKPFASRIYRHYPGTAEDSSVLQWYTPDAEDKGWRADRLQEKGNFAGAVSLLGSSMEGWAADACVARFAWGRAQHKLNNLSLAVTVLDPMGKACREKDPDRAAKALYLAGKSYERKKESGNAARVYARIPEWFPTHSMADDGYALGGIALQDSGDLAGARSLWTKGAEAYPKGDLAAENAWRLAWGASLAGDLPEAIRWADYASETLTLADAPTDVLASMYWAGRWRAWPRDNELTTDPAAKAEAADRLEAVAIRAPWHYYGALAGAQLARLDKERAARLPRPSMDRDDAPWQVPDRFLQSRAGQSTIALARVGLVREALAELNTVPENELSGSLAAIRMLLETRAGDFVIGHDRLRGWLKTRPPETLGPNAYKVLRVAYPDKWWPEVQTAAKGFSWDARLFHALVREESNFNKDIKSHAGACGLSQLMPGTASMVAKQMGISYSASNIYDPATNLKIGAFYFDDLLSDYGGSPMLALSSYNAGPGNSQRWLAALPPNAPADTYTETITFRETRHYVKRVTSTWLMYDLLYGKDDHMPDWSAFVADAAPGR